MKESKSKKSPKPKKPKKPRKKKEPPISSGEMLEIMNEVQQKKEKEKMAAGESGETVPVVEVVECGFVPLQPPPRTPEEPKDADVPIEGRKRKRAPPKKDLWKVPRNRYAKVRREQYMRRVHLAITSSQHVGKEVKPPEEAHTADNSLYLHLLGPRLDAMRHALLVDELMSLAKDLCRKECPGCKADSLGDHGSICRDNVAILLQRFVGYFLPHLLACDKNGEYYIDTRFALVADEIVPDGLEERSLVSPPTC